VVDIMGTSTNANIFYGILLDEEQELPWGLSSDEEDKPEDVEEWWLNLHGIKRDDLEQWNDWRERVNKHLAHNPIPFEEVNYCSEEYPMIALAVPRTVITATRGDPTTIEQWDFVCSAGELLHFAANIKKLGIVEMPTPRWYLSSYWG